MNRYNPYQNPYESPQPRRGGPPNGFGPDRSHRVDSGGPPRGRGFGRGRGRGGGGHHGSQYGGSHDGSYASYDQGPPQGDMGGYNNSFDSAPGQDSFYQNGNFDASGPGQYGQGYNNYEGALNDSGGYDQGGFGGRPKRTQRPREEKVVNDSIIEDRIQRERPCRTLFIRNIKYETSSDFVRGLFEEHGEIKTFFDLIANRGMVFVTYYDLRAAERARERLQGSEISGRPIDVHYSLPRDDGGRGAEKDKQQLQGTLIVTLKNSASGQPIDDNEVRRKFQQFGDVKSVRPAPGIDCRFVEFYDTRASDEAHDRLRHQGLQDGVMEIVFAAAPEDDQRGASPRREERGGYDRGRDWETPPQRGRRGGRGGGRGRGRGSYGGDDWDRRGDWGRDRDRERAPYEEDYSGGRGGGRGRGGGYGGRFDSRGPGGYGGPGPSSPPGPPPPSYGGAPPPSFTQAPPPAQPVDERLERLEQAKKVQQLLAALKQPGATPGAPGNGGAPPPPGMPPMPPQAPPGGNHYYAAPPSMPPFPPNAPPPASAPNGYPGMNQQASTPQPPPAGLAGLAPNLLALLQQNSQGQQRLQQQQQQPPPMPYGMPQQQMMQPTPPPGMPQMPPNTQPNYQQLMAYLGQKHGQ
ncbi:uncharacterized protein C8Q71DRAFT_595977 [Rhodofomes roseus]|uniref:RRM domain-containing protein n=1 Tax=Rhodofomes roseus TaxID=34475 RepID=A0ABQ8KHI0_9APHY|nr:uncharacterized protein C8Q71DRAFT_595977 [Rhodofomes roseus]KAH9837320.1 hypothetical protein C8Q71DRAFT_595977 [Rhodofomes roseus]